jgi:hypothetical protein
MNIYLLRERENERKRGSEKVTKRESDKERKRQRERVQNENRIVLPTSAGSIQ